MRQFIFEHIFIGRVGCLQVDVYCLLYEKFMPTVLWVKVKVNRKKLCHNLSAFTDALLLGI